MESKCFEAVVMKAMMMVVFEMEIEVVVVVGAFAYPLVQLMVGPWVD